MNVCIMYMMCIINFVYGEFIIYDLSKINNLAIDVNCDVEYGKVNDTLFLKFKLPVVDEPLISSNVNLIITIVVFCIVCCCCIIKSIYELIYYVIDRRIRNGYSNYS